MSRWNTLVIDLKSTIMQLRRNSADTISLPVLIVNSADLCGKTCIPEGNCVSPAKFIVVGGPGHSHCCQQVLQFVSSVAEFFDDCCFLALSRAASFSSLKRSLFITSFSALIKAFSSRSRRSSSYSLSWSFLGLLIFTSSSSQDPLTCGLSSYLQVHCTRKSYILHQS